MSATCTCTPRQKETRRYSRKCNAHNGQLLYKALKPKFPKTLNKRVSRILDEMPVYLGDGMYLRGDGSIEHEK